jgi:hypothetical protein
MLPGVVAAQSVTEESGGEFSPTDLAGLQFWYDATDSETTLTSGRVQTIEDLSGNGNNASVNTGDGTALQTNIFGTRSGIRFEDNHTYDTGVNVPAAGTVAIV